METSAFKFFLAPAKAAAIVLMLQHSVLFELPSKLLLQENAEWQHLSFVCIFMIALFRYALLNYSHIPLLLAIIIS